MAARTKFVTGNNPSGRRLQFTEDYRSPPLYLPAKGGDLKEVTRPW